MTVRTIHDLAGGVFVDAKRGPTDKLHAHSWKPDGYGARTAACGLVGRFVPPFGFPDFTAFPKLDEATDATPPRCEKCLLANATYVVKAGG